MAQAIKNNREYGKAFTQNDNKIFEETTCDDVSRCCSNMYDDAVK